MLCSTLTTLDEDVDEPFQKLYQSLFAKIEECTDLHPFQRFFLVDLLRDRQGDRLGSKQIIWLQMLEAGLQKKLGLASPCEFLMFDKRVLDDCFTLVHSKCSEIWRELSAILDSGDEVLVLAITSWKPAHNGLSSKIETTKCIIGSGRKWCDTLPFAAVLDAMTTEDIFSTDYSNEQKASGRARFFDKIGKLQASPCGVLFLDTNKLIFEDDAEYGNKSIQAVLTTDLGFAKRMEVMDGEIALCCDAKRAHFVILHRPLSIASDSRNFIPMEVRARRGLAAAVLCDLRRRLDRQPSLHPGVTFENPVYAMMAFQTLRLGFHQGWQHCAAFYRDCVSGVDTLALTNNNLPKSAKWQQDAPVSQYLREKSKATRASKVAKVQIDRLVVFKWRSVISLADGATSEVMCDQLDRLVKNRSCDSRLWSSRWKILMGIVTHGSNLDNVLKGLRAIHAKNKGNQQSGAGKSATNEQVRENDVELGRLLENHSPDRSKPGEPFWIRESKHSQKPVSGTGSVCGDFEFPGGFHVFESLTFGGLQTRCSSKKRKGNTDAHLSTKINFRPFRVACKANSQQGIKVCANNISKGQAYLLVQFLE